MEMFVRLTPAPFSTEHMYVPALLAGTPAICRWAEFSERLSLDNVVLVSTWSHVKLYSVGLPRRTSQFRMIVGLGRTDSWFFTSCICGRTMATTVTTWNKKKKRINFQWVNFMWGLSMELLLYFCVITLWVLQHTILKLRLKILATFRHDTIMHNHLCTTQLLP